MAVIPLHTRLESPISCGISLSLIYQVTSAQSKPSSKTLSCWKKYISHFHCLHYRSLYFFITLLSTSFIPQRGLVMVRERAREALSNLYLILLLLLSNLTTYTLPNSALFACLARFIRGRMLSSLLFGTVMDQGCHDVTVSRRHGVEMTTWLAVIVWKLRPSS